MVKLIVVSVEEQGQETLAVRVLIAEDEPISRRMLENALKSWGYEVIVTRNGQEAWKALNTSDRPGLVILDWMMPGANGVEICRWLRSCDSQTYTYIILLTARNFEGDMVTALEAGADDYIVKPFKAEELKYRLQIGQRIIEQEKKILNLAQIDDLTGLLTRRAFREKMEIDLDRFRKEAGCFGIIIGDIDNFKVVNDTYGHQVGDQVLQFFARCLRNNSRTDDYVGRYGGEEFIIGVPGANLQETKEVAERFRKAIETSLIPLLSLDHAIFITASFGVDCVDAANRRNRGSDELIHNADEALYMAKNQGRNRTVVFPRV